MTCSFFFCGGCSQSRNDDDMIYSIGLPKTSIAWNRAEKHRGLKLFLKESCKPPQTSLSDWLGVMYLDQLLRWCSGQVIWRWLWCCCGLGWLCHCICIAPLSTSKKKPHYNKVGTLVSQHKPQTLHNSPSHTPFSPAVCFGIAHAAKLMVSRMLILWCQDWAG